MKKVLLLILFLTFPGPARAIKVERLTGPVAGLQAGAKGIEVVAEEALVMFSSGTTDPERSAIMQSVGGQVVKALPGGWMHVSLGAGTPVAAGLASLRNMRGVDRAEPNHVYRPVRVPNDPLIASQWSLSQISAQSAWEYEVGTSCKTTIVVIDAGLQGTNQELSGKLSAGGHLYCSPGANKNEAAGADLDNPACVAEALPTAACNHATRVSGVAAAAANNGLQIAGVSWGAQLLSVKVFRDIDCPSSDCSDGTCGTDDTAVMSAISYATGLQNTAQYGKIVINMSLGAAGAACPGAPFTTALAAAAANGIPVAIATGNDGSSVNSPANCAADAAVIAAGGGVIPVGATDASNNIAFFSSRGPELSAYGVVAPGSGVLTTDLNNGTASATGTSFATPHVAGLAALILSAKPTCPGAATCAVYAQNIVRGGADSIGVSGLGLSALPLGDLSGAGRINAFRSLRLAINGTLADFEGDQKAIAYPNPFRTSQTGSVSFTIPLSLQGRNAKISIYTVSGEFVRELSGLTWDGKNTDGKPVATGTYIFVVSTDKGTAKNRLAVIR
ncbi:MAG: S8 family serine peptidase [Elusimicrobiota bacterium]|jgi:subtilisin family serine protease